MEKLTKKNSILYNQEWINKAIEEGYIEFLPTTKIPNNKSIGEWLEIKYKQLDNEELDRHLYNGTIKEYRRQTELTPKITKENSLLYRELFKEEIKPQNKQLSGGGHSRKKLRK